ncbi:MAG: amidohydrolase family protein [Candidatus Freyarchaeum deiterrae]
MVIDAHNHVGGPDKGDKMKQSPEEIVANMHKVGIDQSVIFPFNEINPGVSFSLANDYIAAAVKKYPERLIGFARLDPNYGDRAVQELDRAVNKLGLRGVKLHPTSQNFSLDNPYVLRIIKRASELEIPVIFDSGKELSPPEKIGKLAEQVPKAKIILGHMRGDNYLEVAKRFDNVHLGTAGMFKINLLEEALQKLGAEKLVAGSDSPYTPQKLEIEKFDFIPGITRETKKKILGQNMREILEL